MTSACASSADLTAVTAFLSAAAASDDDYSAILASFSIASPTFAAAAVSKCPTAPRTAASSRCQTSIACRAAPFTAPQRSRFRIKSSSLDAGLASRSLAVAPAWCAFLRLLGSFYTSEWRGGVERRQVELKGVEGGE